MDPAITQARQAHLLLYDGECGFCHEAVRFVLARDPKARFRFAALQGRAAAEALAPFGGVPRDLSTFYVLAPGPPPRLLARAKAALEVARVLGGPWRAALVLRALPAPWLDAAYDAVARRRHALLGRRDACFVPDPSQRGRFLDDPGAPR